MSDEVLSSLLERLLKATPEKRAAVECVLAGVETSGPQADNEGYIDKREVARRLGKSMRAIDGYMANGFIPFFKLGRTVVFRWSEVVKHLEQNHRICLRGVK